MSPVDALITHADVYTCLQVEPATPASPANLICIISGLPWFGFFHDVLRGIALLQVNPKVHMLLTLFTCVILMNVLKTEVIIPTLLDRILGYLYPTNWLTRGELLVVNLETQELLRSIATGGTNNAQKARFIHEH